MLVHNALLQWDDGVVCDSDSLRADFCAALRDVAETDAVIAPEVVCTACGIERMHFESCSVHQEPWTDELLM